MAKSDMVICSGCGGEFPADEAVYFIEVDDKYCKECVRVDMDDDFNAREV